MFGGDDCSIEESRTLVVGAAVGLPILDEFIRGIGELRDGDIVGA